MILFEIDKGSKKRLHATILLFDLAISLRLEGSKKLLLEAEKIA